MCTVHNNIYSRSLRRPHAVRHVPIVRRGPLQCMLCAIQIHARCDDYDDGVSVEVVDQRARNVRGMRDARVHVCCARMCVYVSESACVNPRGLLWVHVHAHVHVLQ